MVKRFEKFSPNFSISLIVIRVNHRLACVAGGIRERASGGAASDTAPPLALTASLPKQKHSREKSRQLRRLIFAILN